jgi:hypothetical protein
MSATFLPKESPKGKMAGWEESSRREVRKGLVSLVRRLGKTGQKDQGVGGAVVPLSQAAGPMLLSVRLHCCHSKICESVALCSRSPPQPLPPSNPPSLTPLCLMAQQRMDLLKWSEPVK